MGNDPIDKSRRRSAYRRAIVGLLLVFVIAAVSVSAFYYGMNRALAGLLTQYRDSRRAAVEAAVTRSRDPAVTTARELATSGELWGLVNTAGAGDAPAALERAVSSLGFAAVGVADAGGALLYENGVIEGWPDETRRESLSFLADRIAGEPEAQVLAYVPNVGLYWLAGARIMPAGAEAPATANSGFVVVVDAIGEDEIAHIESVTGVRDLQVLPGSLTASADEVVAADTVVVNREEGALTAAPAGAAPAALAGEPAAGAQAATSARAARPPGSDQMADSLSLGAHVGSDDLAISYRNDLPLAEAQMARWAQGMVASFAAVVVCLLFFVIAGLTVFVQPMRRLSASVSALAQTGRWTHPRTGYREFQRVADALWVSLDRMHRAEAELLGAQERLERRVEERTSELARANLALAESEERYRAVVEDLPVFVCRLTADFSVSFVNQAYCRYFQVEADRIVGTRLFDGIPEEARAEVMRVYGSLTVASPTATHEMRVVDDQGRARWTRWAVRALLDGFGQIVGYQAVGQDITEQRELEEQLRQAQKMETVGRLAGGVAHDFNNIVTAIMGHASFALEAAKDNDAVSADIREVLKSAERARKVTQQLLAFSRRQTIELRLVNLNDLVADMDRMLRRLIGEHVDLVTIPGQPMGRVRADYSQIEQVLVNLVINARDAMPDGGTVTVETALVDLDESYQAKDSELKPGRFVMLAVSDTGSGMDEETRSHLFEPFYTTKEVGRGSGLGLATVYGIVKQHGGHIWVYSEVGKGSCFKVYLPLAQEPEGCIGELENPPERIEDTGVVLVAEDDPAVRLVTRRILEAHGYEVIEAAGGEEAMRLAGERPGPIDLLVTDVVMPQMSGRELAARLNGSRPGLSVLYVSGYSDNYIGNHGVLDEGVDFLQKPFSEAALLNKVRAAIHRVEATACE